MLRSLASGARRRLLVASHNIQDGLHLPQLLEYYQTLQQKSAASPLHALCIQEAVPKAAPQVPFVGGHQPIPAVKALL